jgi:hypothetical protein
MKIFYSTCVMTLLNNYYVNVCVLYVIEIGQWTYSTYSTVYNEWGNLEKL